MSYRVMFWSNIRGKSEVTVTNINIQDGLIIKGDFRTPIENIKYIEELG